MNSTDALKKLQQMLNATLVPSPRLSVDGVMGPKTRSALARYNAAKERIGEGDVGRLISANTSSDSADTTAGSPASDAWMSIAEAELGTAEVAGTARNQRIIAYHSATSLEAKSDEVPWCSSFVNWVMRQAGYTSTNSALARSWLGWGVACGPRYGAITIIKKRSADSDVATGSSTGFHVGFLIEATRGRVRLLGGNQGDMVKLSNFYLTGYDVRGYRWPQ
jgi:uncharacterized protein (TIGR02594 family)